MDAGVPIKSPVAGVAMGLVMDGDRVQVLTDIAGEEDHYGDMDFKVAGTREGITALQMDIKIGGLKPEMMAQALEQAKAGRLHILDRMLEALAQPRTDISPFAPRILTIRVAGRQDPRHHRPGRQDDPLDRRADGLQDRRRGRRPRVDRLGGRVGGAASRIAIIEELTATPELNKTYLGKVVRVVEFGAFVEILPGTDGLLHVSEMAHHRVQNVRDEVKEGDQVLVKVVSIDPSGKIRLSRKALLEEAQGGAAGDGGSGDGGVPQGEGGAAGGQGHDRPQGGGHGYGGGHDRPHGGGHGRPGGHGPGGGHDRRPGGGGHGRGPGGGGGHRRDRGR